MPQNPVGANSSSSVYVQQESRIAHNVAMRFKDESAKFSGHIGQSWQEFVDEYLQVTRDYELSPTQRLNYLHNLLAGDAKRFYLDHVQPYAANYQQAIEMVNKEYNSNVRQNRVKNYLNSLRISQFAGEGLDELACLEKCYKVITKLARQVPKAFQGDAHRVEFLRGAVVGSTWATEPLSRIATHSLDFQKLYGELEAALNLERESKRAAAQDAIHSSAPTLREDNVPGILYQGQGRYMRPAQRSNYPENHEQSQKEYEQ